MPKKYIYILIGIIILALATLLVLFLMKSDTPKTGGFFSLPFGDAPEGGEISIPTNPSNDTQTPATNINMGAVRQISASPVSGATIITSSSTSVIRYVDRGTGHVFDYDIESGLNKRVSNTTIPKAHEIIWSADGSLFVMRLLSGSLIKDFSANLVPSATSTVEGELDLTGTYLVGQKYSIVASPDGKKIFYTVPNTGQSVVGVISSFDGSGPSTIWQFPTKEWRIAWPTLENLFLTTKASSAERGYSYLLDAKTGEMTGVLSRITGLTANPSPDLKYILYSEQNKDRTNLFLMELASGQTNPVGPSTLAEKCVWSKNERLTVYCGASGALPAGLPDSWYKGLVSFNDEIWKINFETGETKLLANKDAFGAAIDAYNLETSEDGKVLIFQNKKNLTLWAVMLGIQ